MRKMCLRLLLIFVVIGCGSGAAGLTDAGSPGPTDSARDAASDAGNTLGGQLQTYLSNPVIPAMAALVSSHGEVHDGVAGVRALGQSAEATTNDVWHLGSCAKAMTATLLARLAEQGGLSLDTRLADAFGNFTWLHPAFVNVTLEQLLQHLGGLPENVPDLDAYRASRDTLPSQRARAAQEALSAAPAQAVGTFSYSNLGYIIVAAALERQTGMSYEALMQREVFGPLGMASCVFGHPGSDSVVDQPRAHDLVNGQLQALVPSRSDNPRLMAPAGGIACSLRDWAKFVAAHLPSQRSTGYLPPASWDRLHRVPAGGDYAAGWIQEPRSWAGGDAWTHTGSNTVNYAMVWVAPAREWFVLIAINRGEDPDAPDEPVFGVLDGVVADLLAQFRP